MKQIKSQKGKKLGQRREEKMWKKSVSVALQPWRMIAYRHSSIVSSSAGNSSKVSSAVNSILLRSLKEHYHEVSKMTPPPKVGPPSPFTVVKGALEREGPVLKRTYNEEDINISAMRMANMDPEKDGEDDEETINQIFIHVHITKPTQQHALQFLCGLYPDALGIHSVAMRPKAESAECVLIPNSYAGPAFQDMDERMRDALHGFIQERGINESLFPFLQAFLYVKDHRKLMHWFKSIGMLLTDSKQATSKA